MPLTTVGWMTVSVALPFAVRRGLERTAPAKELGGSHSEQCQYFSALGPDEAILRGWVPSMS